MPRRQRNRAYPRRRGRRHRPRVHPGQDLPRRARINGAPFSIVAITSAKVGPFDLGTVVIRFALTINPTTAEVECRAGGVRSDPAHHQRDRRPRPRHPRLHRPPELHDQPHQLQPQTFSATRRSAAAQTPPTPRISMPVTINDPFQAADCQNLQFKPRFKVSTCGQNKQSRRGEPDREAHLPHRRARHPGEHQRGQGRPPQTTPLTPHDAAEGVHRRTVQHQPRRMPSGVEHRSRQGDHPDPARPPRRPRRTSSPTAAKHSPASRSSSRATASRSTSSRSTFISKAGITSSTFHTVPDQPVTSFELTLPEGKYSALAANGNLCTSKLAMPTEFVAQNGAEIHQIHPDQRLGLPQGQEDPHPRTKTHRGAEGLQEEAKAKRAAMRTHRP